MAGPSAHPFLLVTKYKKVSTTLVLGDGGVPIPFPQTTVSLYQSKYDPVDGVALKGMEVEFLQYRIVSAAKVGGGGIEGTLESKITSIVSLPTI